MRKVALALVVVGVLLLAASTPAITLAQGSVDPRAVAAWTGEYFNNIALSGTPAFARDDANIDFVWSEGISPVPGYVNVNNYSVRWTRTINFNSAGKWTFHFVADDGVRIWVDNQIVINAWYDQGATPHIGMLNLTAGWHTVRVEYYNKTGAGTAKLNYWGEVAYSDWKAEYFTNPNLAGAPMFIRNDPNIDFNWGMGSPEVRIPPDNFSVRWQAHRQFPGGVHQFSITSDDGARVWVDGTLLIDAWYDRPPTTSSATRSLAPGPHDVRVEYYERGGNASVSLKIAMEMPPPVGEIVVDDRGPGWTMGGPAAYWHNAANGIGGQSLWTYNNSYNIRSYNWGRWTPTLRYPGNYEVFAYIPRGVGTTLSARYWIYHARRYDLVARRQGLSADQWMSLGTYAFDASGGENVLLSDVTYECYLCRTLVFDAVKFVPR